MISILDSHPAQPGWVCCYIVPGQGAEPPLIMNLPVVLWTLIEYEGKLTDGTVGNVQQFRPYVANRHGGITDYQSTQMEFLCMVPPYEDWQKVSQAAFEHWIRGRAALEEAKRQAAERVAEAEKPPGVN